MEAERYGIRLASLKADQLEMVRQWRNADHVRPFMTYREVIHPEGQEEWFRSLQTNKDFYFIFYDGKTPVGLINLKAMHTEIKTAEAGIFTGDTRYLGSTVPLRAILVLMDLAFYFFGLEKLFARIEDHHCEAIAMNQALGYAPLPKVQETSYTHYEVTEPVYRRNTGGWRQVLDKQFPRHYLRLEERETELQILKAELSAEEKECWGIHGDGSFM